MFQPLRVSLFALAAIALPGVVTIGFAADEVIVDQIREQVRPAPGAPPKAEDAKVEEDEGEDVKPAEVDLKPPKIVADEEKGFNQLHEPPGRVKPVAKRPTGRIPLISTVIRDIATEARQGWAVEREWPHDMADHSTRTQEMALLNRQIIMSLMKRQDSHASVDGYIRWQLLSYAPDLSEARPPEIRAIIANLPPLTRLPVPPKARNVLDRNGGGAYFFSGVQKAFLSDLTPVAGARGYNPTLSVAGSGAGLSFETAEEVIQQSRAAAYDHVQSRPLIERLNGPTVLYRDALMQLIPTEGGLRLEALFLDMKDRLEAGDPSYKDACQAFFNEAHRTQSDQMIPERTRANLMFQMRNLARKKTLVLQEIEIDRAGAMRVKREAVAFPAQHLDTLLGYLKGPEVAAEKQP